MVKTFETAVKKVIINKDQEGEALTIFLLTYRYSHDGSGVSLEETAWSLA